ncbi:VOC family protein [Kiritimatiellota bacterium B12222]|nr:VOC family protein [Kiritimatiellota bacterium B12222]
MNRLASIVIYVPGNAKEILDFYVAAFDLKLKHYDESFDFGELDTGETTIAVANHSAGKFMVGDGYEQEADGFPKNTELAFIADDVGMAYSMAVKNGCIGLCPPKDMPWGQTVAYVKSIEGTLVGLLSKTPAT